jgi:Bacteriophage lambda head decoration protein D
MPLTTFDPQDIVAGPLPLVHDNVTVLSGQNLVRGDILGRITASGKYIKSLQAAVDGSQTPIAIAATAIDASAADKIGPVYIQGEFASQKLGYGTGHTMTTVNAAFRVNGQSMVIRDIGAVA